MLHTAAEGGTATKGNKEGMRVLITYGAARRGNGKVVSSAERDKKATRAPIFCAEGRTGANIAVSNSNVVMVT